MTHAHTHTHTHTHTHLHSIGLFRTSDRARRKHLYLITHHSQETVLHAPAGFEPAIPACERPHTHALARATTGISCIIQVVTIV